MSLHASYREHVVSVLDAAIRAVDPRAAVRAHVTRSGDFLRIGERGYRLSEIDRIVVVGGGKAGTPMAAAIHEILPEHITAGVVNVKYGHTAAAGDWEVRFEHRPSARSEARMDGPHPSSPSRYRPHRHLRSRPPGARCRGSGRRATHRGPAARADRARPRRCADLRRRVGAAAAARGRDHPGRLSGADRPAAALRCGHHRDQHGAQALLAAARGATGPAGRARAGGDPHPLRRRRDALGRHRLRPDRPRPQQFCRRVAHSGTTTASPSRRPPPCARISAAASRD